MFKKIFYIFTILAMLFGMFGVMGQGGVTPARAAWALPPDAFPPAAFVPADLPYYSGVMDSFGAVEAGGLAVVWTAAAGDPIDCGQFQFSGWVGFTTSNPAGLVTDPQFAHISVANVNAGLAWNANVRFGVWDAATGDLVACSAGAANLVIPITAGDTYNVMIGIPAVAPAPVTAVSDRFELIIAESRNDSSLIVAFTGTAADFANAEASISTIAGGEVTPFATYTVGADADVDGGFLSAAPLAYAGLPAAPRFVVFDVPAGNYNLGTYDKTGTGLWIRPVPSVAGGTTVVVDENLAATNVTVNAATVAAGVLPLTLGIQTSAVPLFSDMRAGVLAGGPPSTLTFRVPAFYTFDLAGWLDNAAAGNDYFLVQQSLLVATVNWRLNLPANAPAAALLDVFEQNLNADGDETDAGEVGWEDAKLWLDPPGVLAAREFDITDITPLGNATASAMFLRADTAYNAAPTIEGVAFGVALYQDPDGNNAVKDADEWTYYLAPAVSTWSFPAWVDADVDGIVDVAEAAYAPLFGEEYIDDGFTFKSDATTSAELYTVPVAAGEVLMTRENWLDADDNIVNRITSPDNTEVSCTTQLAIADVGLAVDGLAPCDTLESVLGDLTQLANDYLLTDLGPAATTIGRYDHQRFLQVGVAGATLFNSGFGALVGGVSSDTFDDLFAVQGTDTAGHWAWSWVQALYELGYTTGIGGNAYGPDQTMTRAQMAVFLSRVLSDNSSIPAAGAGVGGVFTDVPAAFWAGGAIEQLEDLGITSGCGGGLYCPNAMVTRAEMSKFIQTSFRAARTFGWDGCDLDGDGSCATLPLGTDLWDPNQNVLAPGETFIDVPAGHWANLWIEEMDFDNLTSGCTYGVYDPGVRYFCPEDDVTRGQMAKFIVTALFDDPDIQGFWPILAPER